MTFPDEIATKGTDSFSAEFVSREKGVQIRAARLKHAEDCLSILYITVAQPPCCLLAGCSQETLAPAVPKIRSDASRMTPPLIISPGSRDAPRLQLYRLPTKTTGPKKASHPLQTARGREAA